MKDQILTALRWKMGELLPGHRFRIHDFAVQKETGHIVLLTGTHNQTTVYSYIDLDELERNEAPIDAFRPAKSGEITPGYEVLRRRLIKIMRCSVVERRQKVLVIGSECVILQ